MAPETIRLREEIYSFAENLQPVGVRQVFYGMTVRGHVEKSEGGYNRVQRNMTAMRENDELPYEWVVDGSRQIHEAQSYSGLDEAWSRVLAGTFPQGAWH